MAKVKWFGSVRVFGLFLVLIYHLFYEWLPGGFLGVDVFFTFSGFLITALILGEVRKRGKFDLPKFLVNRIRRIMVPLFFAVAFTLPFALLISTDFTVGIGKQVAAALSFTSNWYNIIAGSSYEAQLLPQMYVHTWALSVIVQFYLAWGALCALIVVIFRAIHKKTRSKLYGSVRITVLVLSCIITLGSFLYLNSLYSADNDLSFIYFNTLARFFSFFIGSIAAVIWGLSARQDNALKKRLFSGHTTIKAIALIITTILAAGTIVFMSVRFTFDDEFVYRYGFLASSLLTVVLIYSTHGLHILTPSSVAEPRVVRAVERLSYDAYLYHWPVFIIISALMVNKMDAAITTLIVTAFACAIMVYCVQRVVIPQQEKNKAKHKRVAMVAIFIPVIAAVAAGGVVIARAPVITSIESDFASGFIVQDTRGLISLSSGISALNRNPVIYNGATDPLQPNILPAPPPWSPPVMNPQQPPAQQDDQEPNGGEEPDAEPGDDTADQNTGASPTPTPPPTPVPTPPPPPIYTPTPPDHGDLVPDPSQRPVHIPIGVSIIGDSVSLGAQAALINTIPNCVVDSEVSRAVRAGAGIITSMQNKGELREYVVIALGTNGTNNYARLMTEIIEAVNPGHRLIFVTPFDGRSNNNARAVSNTAVWMRDLPDLYDFITIADWNEIIGAQQNLLAGDRVHMGGTASRTLYAEMILDAIEIASRKPTKS